MGLVVLMFWNKSHSRLRLIFAFNPVAVCEFYADFGDRNGWLKIPKHLDKPGFDGGSGDAEQCWEYSLAGHGVSLCSTQNSASKNLVPNRIFELNPTDNYRCIPILLRRERISS